MELNEFALDFLAEIRYESYRKCDLTANVFFDEMLSRLEEMEYIFDPSKLSFFKQGSNGRIMKFDAFAFDETDKSLVLIANEFIDDENLDRLTQTDINQIYGRLINFLDEVYNNTIFKFMDPSQDSYKLATMLKNKFDIDYITLDKDESIEKIKLFIITNKKLSNRVANLKKEDFHNRFVELNVWDIERIYHILNSGKEKESIIIDFPEFNCGKGINYLQADINNIDYDAYLCILPGKVLSDIYYMHGSRLLEGNVRAFLSVRGKINKGIRNTILKEPDRFFTYNNGIACTAKSLEFSEDMKYITKMEDLQIINGGQTTASLTSAKIKDKSKLENIFVPMKLTVIKSEEYGNMIQNISRYANSQNKVTEADLFSNHQFHVEFENLSQKCPAPPKANELYTTFWFYERSRGKYEQSRFKIAKKSDLDAFYKKYPKKQVIKKEELAKYLMTGIYLRPDIVSKGSAKNMIEFSKRIDDQWNQDKNVFNQKYFEAAVCYAILFRTIDLTVSNAEWYNKGGYKLNIVPYTMAKLIHSIPKDLSLDFNKIWKNQELNDVFIEEINILGKITNDFITDASGVIITEYAKRDKTWEKFRDVEFNLSSKFLDQLMLKNMINDDLRTAKKDKVLEKEINIESNIYQLSIQEDGNYWRRLIEEGRRRNLITEKEFSIINSYICNLASPLNKKFPSPAQCKIAWAYREKLDENGVIV